MVKLIMSFLNYLQIATLFICLQFTNAAYSQNKVVVIPMFEEKAVFTGIIKTGNTICSFFSEPPGNWISATPCTTLDDALRGQDAELQLGADATPRFTNNTDGTVTDNATGLIWLRNAFCAAEVNDWETALSYVVELNASGAMNGNDCGDTSSGGSNQNDWRLPNIKELQSLLNYGNHGSPYITNTLGSGQLSEGDPFSNLKVDDAYWSSTTYGNILDDAMRVNYDDGTLDGTSKNALLHIWAVRSVPSI